jgi:hypothetical protein
MRLISGFCAVTLGLAAAHARLTAADLNSPCISALELPRTTAGIPRDWLPEGQDGTVRIRLRVDAAGAVADLSLSGAT